MEILNSLIGRVKQSMVTLQKQEKVKTLRDRIKDMVSCFISCVKKHNIHLYLCSILFVFYCIWAYEDVILQWYDKQIIEKYLSRIVSNIALQLLWSLLIIFCWYDIIQKAKHKYRYDENLIFVALLFSVVIIWYRYSGLYEYLPWFNMVSYIDTVYLIGLSYVISAIINTRRKQRKVTHKEKSLLILHDFPIAGRKEDIFDLQFDTDKIVSAIQNLNKRRVWSIAVVGQWGVGKTSFINLITECLSKEEFEILHFNPRTSKTISTIQEDFFTLFAGILAKYDSKCGRTIKDYMSSLQLIDNRSVIARGLNLYQLWDKANLKNKIESAIRNIEKRILVVIDDFDRLYKDEILEVLKLIDNNAAFPNIVFLTAYDKKLVNKYFGDVYNTSDAYFVDKFFNLEFSTPQRPYTYISKFILNTLCQNIEADEDEKGNINKVLNSLQAQFPTYIPTLRDAKRFINQFVLDYKLVQGDVFVDEFMGVQLLKYKFPIEYKQLYQKEYISSIPFGETYTLKPDLSEDLNILPLLKLLFPDKDIVQKNYYRHIFETQSFENYFISQIYGTLRIREMDNVFQDEISTALSNIDSWLKSEQETKDIIDYLSASDVNILPASGYQRLLELITYIAVMRPETHAFRLFCKLIKVSNIENYKKQDKDLEEKYRKLTLDTILNIKYDNNLHLARSLHVYYKTGDLNEGQFFIKDNDIWLTIKRHFLGNLRKDEDKDEGDLIKWLYDCIDTVEDTTRRCVLDKDCLNAFKEHITQHPHYYVSSFVRLAAISSHPDFNSVTCEPFWEQIFSSSANFEEFMEECKRHNIPEIERVNNFWLLYKANDMKPIGFERQGNVQDKIDSNLTNEVAMLEQLQKIQREVDTISSKDISEGKKSKLGILSEKLNKIELNISLTGKIQMQINELLESL